MSKKLKYKIISCSSQESQYPSSSLLFGGQNGGWQTKRFCTYPQQVTFEFYGPVKIDKIEIVSDNRKIPSQVDILFYMPFQPNGRQADQRFQKYGFLNFNRNQNSQLREQKSIMVDIKCVYLRFLLHKPHASKENFFSQIGIHQITIYGNDINSTFAPLQKLPRQFGHTIGTLDSYNTVDEDPFIVEKLSILNAQKERAVEAEDFEAANQCKLFIDQVKKAGEQLKKLNYEKRIAIEQQDYQKANNLKKSIQQHRKYIEEMISIDYNQNPNGYEQNQFVQQNHSPINDFQDNEFVDPQMNQIIEKSATFSNKGQNSRVLGSNSRVILNKSLLKKENDKQKENYDDRVIPTLAAGNKLKTEESQVIEKEDDKKTELKLQEIDGKYIQYSIIMQEHFDEDTVKRFFSQHWQHKVQALGTILKQTKNKQNGGASFIKCLMVVVKNSVSETNFQVAISSLQLFCDMLKMNAKGNSLNRTNQVANDLDSISKQVIKKMTDNNNKIKQEAQKAIAQMINSPLYGPELCVIAMTKIKEKVKLSSKQLISRLTQVKKIINKNTNNQQIIMMATDFAIQNVKNPSGDVRNQSMNILLLCREKDKSGIVEKKIEEKNISQLIQAYQSKNQSKVSDRLSKNKKSK